MIALPSPLTPVLLSPLSNKPFNVFSLFPNKPQWNCIGQNKDTIHLVGQKYCYSLGHVAFRCIVQLHLKAYISCYTEYSRRFQAKKRIPHHCYYSHLNKTNQWNGNWILISIIINDLNQCWKPKEANTTRKFGGIYRTLFVIGWVRFVRVALVTVVVPLCRAKKTNALVLLTKSTSSIDSGLGLNQVRLPFDPRRRPGDFPLR